MVLSKPEILRYIQEGKLRFDPPVSDSDVAQVSVDLHLGRKFTRFKEPPGFLHAIQMDDSIWQSLDLWEHLEQGSFLLKPGEFVLAQTLEKISIPNDLVGLVEGRSSWARLGITIHITAPKIDPGFNAPITLEMANFGRVPVNLRPGIDQPAQLILLQISHPLEVEDLYGSKDGDIFQHQEDPIPHKKSS